MNLSPSMRTFGTSLNHEFGDVEETAILIDIGIYINRRLIGISIHTAETISNVQ